MTNNIDNSYLDFIQDLKKKIVAAKSKAILSANRLMIELAQSVREISWGQNILIFEKCKDKKEQEYYIKNTIEYGWNRNVLLHHT